jgi:CMP-N-acetylneuraminic acid synthetase
VKIAAFIFARGGSKGLPGKNIKPFCGKPLIAWSIEQALAVDGVENVFVSTDSLEIAAVAKEFGAQIPFIRPADLADDTSPEWNAWRHALNYYEEFMGALPEIFLSVPATSPLRIPSDIGRALEEFKKGDVDAVIAVTEAHRSPFFNMIKADDCGYCQPVVQLDKTLDRRQDAPLVYDMTTVAYALRPEFIRTSDSLFEGRVRAVHIPVERSIDIDTLFDFEIAEFLYNNRANNNVDI